MSITTAQLTLLGGTSRSALSNVSLLNGEASRGNVTRDVLSGAFTDKTGQNQLQDGALSDLSTYISENIKGPVAEALQADVAALNALQSMLNPEGQNDPVFSLLSNGEARIGQLIDSLA